MTDPNAAAGPTGRDTIDPETDSVQPFQLDRSSLRGRMVRAGATLDEILGRHNYPEPVARLLAETITLAVTLAAALKYEGIFTLQTKGDGPVRYTVADITSAGDVRGYAAFDAEALEEVLAQPGAQADLATLLGKGYVAFTVDQGEHTERYQGIVELMGETLDDAVRHYFRQSEQLATGIKLSVGKTAEGRWAAGAIMLQTLPEEDAGRVIVKASDQEDDWRRTMMLLGTCTDAELTDASLPINTLLFRLFHEEQVRVYTRHAIRPGCRCSRERVETVLRSISRDELQELKVDGQVEVTCEFCSSTYRFDDTALDKVYRA